MTRREFAGLLACLAVPGAWAAGPGSNPLPLVQIHWDRAGRESLRREPRLWIPAEVTIDGRPTPPARVRIKGRTGSFQPVDRRPSLTIDWPSGPGFEGTSRIHLENSLEDPGRLDAAFGAEAFRRVGIPSPPVGWASVHADGRELGWYVLRHGLTAELASRLGWPSDTLLAEPVQGGDVGAELDFKAGSDLARQAARERWLRLADALDSRDPVERLEKAAREVDVAGFLRFAVAEVLLAHRDGYALARNNYRLRFDSGGVSWIPWGMDQLLSVERLGMHPQMGGRLVAGLMDCPGIRQAWDAEAANLMPRLLRLKEWEGWMDSIRDRLTPALNRSGRRELGRGLNRLRDRLVARTRFLEREMSARKPELALRPGETRALEDWQTADLPHPRAAGAGRGLGGFDSIWLEASGMTSASWRVRLQLDPGKYRFEGRAATEGIEPLKFGTHQGAALRLLGKGGRSRALVGTCSWTVLAVEFVVADGPGDMSLLCELRARAGKVWFERGSLKLVRIE